jgi:predicted CopG family antitoxin
MEILKLKGDIMPELAKIKQLEEQFFSNVIDLLDTQQKTLIEMIEQTKIETINEIKDELADIKNFINNLHPCTIMLERIINEIKLVK